MEENVTSDVSRHFSFEVYVHFTILEIIIDRLSKGIEYRNNIHHKLDSYVTRIHRILGLEKLTTGTTDKECQKKAIQYEVY